MLNNCFNITKKYKLTWKGFLRSSSMEISILMLSQPRLEWILRDTGNWRPPRLLMRRLTLSPPTLRSPGHHEADHQARHRHRQQLAQHREVVIAGPAWIVDNIDIISRYIYLDASNTTTGRTCKGEAPELHWADVLAALSLHHAKPGQLVLQCVTCHVTRVMSHV